MGFNFTFRLMESRKDLETLLDFLMKQSLGYPKYEAWVQRAEHEIKRGYKTAILAFSGGFLVGDLIYQPHKDLPRTRELKNMRIHPNLRRRYFAHFMLKQAEVESREDYDLILCDVRSDQPAVINLMKLFGYTSLVTTCLYNRNMQDVIMVKSFDKTSEEGILYRTQKFILSNNNQ